MAEAAQTATNCRTYVSEECFVRALGSAITGDGDAEGVKVFDLEALMTEILAEYPTAKVNSVRQRIYKINKALAGDRKFIPASGPDSRKRDLSAYLTL